MKKLLLLITALFILASMEGQILRYSNYTEPTPPSGYTTQYDAVLAAWTNDPTGDTLTYQNDLIYSLDTCDFAGGASLWDRMDVLYVFANGRRANSLINWIAPTGDDNCTDGNSTVFTAYRGFNGDGSSDYLNTNFVVSSEATNITQNSGTFGIYCREESNADTYEFGAADGFAANVGMYIRSNGDHQMYSYVNSDTRLLTPNSTGIGLGIATRRSSTDVENYMNGTSLNSGSVISSGLTQTYPIYILALNNSGTASGFSANEVAIFFAMNSITDAEASALHTIFDTYLTAVGGL